MALRPQGLISGIGFLARKKTRPDKDKSGRLRPSTDLYYRQQAEHDDPAGIQPAFHPGRRTLLELKNISRTFGGLKAVDDLSFAVHEREIVSIIGPNGAGKTTLFNLISGIYPPSAGKVYFEGSDITGLKPHKVVIAGIARTFQNLRLFNNMSVLDNARVGRFCRTGAGPISVLLHLPRHRREEIEAEQQAKEILALFGARLTGYRFDQQAMFLSYANRRRLEIARAMATGAKLLLLDEPSAGMNPQETSEITEFIKALRDNFDYTIVVIEHKLNVVRTISDRVIALDYGIKIAEGSYDEVACSEQVIESYLGRKRQ
jgi:ABC-type branched-subunit amino acid transport system ATPase component